MSGYLEKKGGKLGNKGWDRRYFELANGKLNYYPKERSERPPDQKPLGIIPLRDMLDVRPTPATKAESRHRFRFELETQQRTWYFNAHTANDLTQWMMTLGAMIQTYVSSPEDTSIGGRMANPEKCGWVKMRGNDFLQQWTRRCV